MMLGSSPAISAMSRSKRKVKHEMPGDGCWFCDTSARQKNFNKKKMRPDPEQAKEIQDYTDIVQWLGRLAVYQETGI